MAESEHTEGHQHHVRIHIDEKRYESPNPTTGHALYALGNVRPGYELYREVSGNKEDTPVPNGPEKVHLKEDDHFHSGEPHKKVFTIFVNGRAKEVTTNTVSFTEIVTLANLPSNPNTIFTVTYKHGVHDAHGEMVEGDTVKVKNRMNFNVTPTDKS